MKTFILSAVTAALITTSTGVVTKAQSSELYTYSPEYIVRNSERDSWFEYLDACNAHEVIKTRIVTNVIHEAARLPNEIAATMPYKFGTGAAPKSQGMNDAPWTCSPTLFHGHGHQVISRNEDGSIAHEELYLSIHGWPTGAGMKFDDSEEKKEQAIAESRGYTEANPAKLYYAAHDEFFMPSNSQLQARALSSLVQICIKRGISPDAFTKQQLHKFVLDYMDKHGAAQYGITNISEVSEDTTPNFNRFA